MKREVRLKYIN